ncbi:LOW QUALITY PROTEIN: hypothetical protein MKX08_003557 [Trichoderma sp. CBMAI-0020]|nr:LOW QUALITY PROTEIN: hypothetical protein MKX08_003557 [Trichoderma sp. CBMAI-0020]
MRVVIVFIAVVVIIAIVGAIHGALIAVTVIGRCTNLAVQAISVIAVTVTPAKLRAGGVILLIVRDPGFSKHALEGDLLFIHLLFLFLIVRDPGFLKPALEGELLFIHLLILFLSVLDFLVFMVLPVFIVVPVLTSPFTEASLLVRHPER